MITIIRNFDLGAKLGLGIVVLLSPYSEVEIVGNVWESPNSKHWLGTDNVGRDLMTRILTGGRMTVIISLMATWGAFLIGCPLGIAAAVVGGWFELMVTRAVDALMASYLAATGPFQGSTPPPGKT